MLVDITLKITPKMIKDANGNESKSLVGHLGTHFDIMDKEFPLEYTKTNGFVFDVKGIKNRDIEEKDIDINKIKEGMFILFYTGYIEEEGYGSAAYFKHHPQLSTTLIDILVDKKVAMIGIDCAGIRGGKEHTLMDQYLASKNIFVIENVCSLETLINKTILVNTYPLNYQGVTGLPCRIIAEI